MSLNKFLLVCAATLLTAAAYAGTTYKWTDDKGQVQYSQLPPNDRPYTVIRTTSSSGDANAETEGNKEGSATAAKTKTQSSSKSGSSFTDAEKEKLAKNCDIAKQNREMLRTAAKIRVTDEKGEPRHLTEEERKTRLADTEKQMEFYCKE